MNLFTEYSFWGIHFKCTIFTGYLIYFMTLVSIFQIRSLLNDFAVLIAIVSMVGLDAGIGLKTPKLEVPDDFSVNNIYCYMMVFVNGSVHTY